MRVPSEESAYVAFYLDSETEQRSTKNLIFSTVKREVN